MVRPRNRGTRCREGFRAAECTHDFVAGPHSSCAKDGAHPDPSFQVAALGLGSRLTQREFEKSVLYGRVGLLGSVLVLLWIR